MVLLFKKAYHVHKHTEEKKKTVVGLYLPLKFPSHLQQPSKTKDMSYFEPGKISTWEVANILLHIKKKKKSPTP